MGFEDFAVLLYPTEVSQLRADNDLQSLNTIVKEVQDKWPSLQTDEKEMSQPGSWLRPGTHVLVYDTPTGLLQLFLGLGNLRKDDILISAAFAYCNPRTVYAPFISIIEWLMNQYALYCHIVPDLAPEQEGLSRDIYDVTLLRSRLHPSMEYNRQLWQMDAQSDEEAVLRPGDAVAHFITPLLTVSQ